MEIDDLPDKKKKKRTLHGKVGNIVVLNYSEIVIQLSSTAILVSSDSAVATEVDMYVCIYINEGSWRVASSPKETRVLSLAQWTLIHVLLLRHFLLRGIGYLLLLLGSINAMCNDAEGNENWKCLCVISKGK